MCKLCTCYALLDVNSTFCNLLHLSKLTDNKRNWKANMASSDIHSMQKAQFCLTVIK